MNENIKHIIHHWLSVNNDNHCDDEAFSGIAIESWSAGLLMSIGVML